MQAGQPKQFMLLGGRPVLYYALAAFEKSEVDEIILVTGADEIDYCRAEIVEHYGFRKVTQIIPGGKERYHSVACGLRALKQSGCDIVLIHDGARPFVTEEIIRQMIAESYDLVTDSPTKRIYEAVKKIPKGHVATYGQVAQMAGNPKMARAVGNALHKNPDPEHIPCFRVVNGKGELAGKFAFGGEGGQTRLLEEDGISVKNGRVDLGKYGIALSEKFL